MWVGWERGPQPSLGSPWSSCGCLGGGRGLEALKGRAENREDSVAPSGDTQLPVSLRPGSRNRFCLFLTTFPPMVTHFCG